MDLNTVCFFMFGFLFLGYLLLEGFDYGVGMLLPFLGESDKEKQAILHTMAPVWEGNEVWLIAAGAVLFAGFPHVYATLFSGLYLALLLILVTLILRGVAFEFRNKDSSRKWRKFWDWAIFSGSIVPALLWGIAVTNLISGLPIDGEKQYIGTFGDLLSPYSLTGGLLFALLFLLHGTVYLTLRLAHHFVPQMRKTGLITVKYAILLSAAFVILSFLYTDLAAKLISALSLAALFLALILCRQRLTNQQYIQSFIFSTAAIIAVIAAIFTDLFPRFIVSSLNPAWSLTIYNSASNPLTLKIMTVTMSIALPVVLVFEAWKYYVFRERIDVTDSDTDTQRTLWEQMYDQLMNLATHSRNLVTIIEKAKKIREDSIIKTNEMLKAVTLDQFQEFLGVIQYGRRIAVAIARMIRILKK